jgi:hypothetical protein
MFRVKNCFKRYRPNRAGVLGRIIKPVSGCVFGFLHRYAQSPPRNHYRRGAVNRAPTLGEIVRTYKAASTRMIRQAANPDFAWQRNYYEHIIRNDVSLNRVRQYILKNPSRWRSTGRTRTLLIQSPNIPGKRMSKSHRGRNSLRPIPSRATTCMSFRRARFIAPLRRICSVFLTQ